MQNKPNLKKPKTKIGIVVSDKMQKTAVVKLVNFTTHPLYKKVIRQRRKVKAHNPENIAAKIDDKVRIMPCRPLSKDKRYRIIEVIK
ncbi:MAG: 30S ribosomal protein S17 [Candidatus Omnitrophica bacterium]|nr:30S ribosomal protein S17 [Candidatus Omnitrophota bacterium]